MDRLFNLLALVPATRAPTKDCANCSYREEHLRDDGNGGKLHCYMFRDEPAGSVCGQFQAKQTTRENTT